MLEFIHIKCVNNAPSKNHEGNEKYNFFLMGYSISNLLSPFHNTCCFDFSRYIHFVMHLDV
jgi:hypothetical protein